MSQLSRKDFLRTTALAAGTLLVGSSFEQKKSNMLLSFSTLGCPDWTFTQITDFAAQHGYAGLEVRGIQRQMDLTKSPVFDTAEHRAQTLSLMKKKGLRFVNLGSSAALHLPEGKEREESLAEAKRFIVLASQLQCPFVRVFPNKFPEGVERAATADRIVDGLLSLGAFAKQYKVTILLETHGELVRVADISAIMQRAKHTNVGLVWDVVNMYSVSKEAPALVYQTLKPYIRHTHIKDAKLVNGEPVYQFLGEGEMPIFDAIDILRKDGYKGFYSFEWEKLWHPDLPSPELAIAKYAETMKRHFASI